jgi:4-amino-4-deoxy-L-arabinose transferase-like glycosyltransferase
MHNPLLALPISILLVLISAALGRRLLSVLKVKPDTPLESMVFGIGLGFGVLAYLILGIGLAGWLHAWVLIALVVVALVVSIRQIGDIAGEIVCGLRACVTTKPRASSVLIGCSLAALGALVLIRSLAPPSDLDWDGLAYHLAVPKMYLAHHRIFYVPFLSHSNFPFLIEMLYTLGLSLGSIGAAKLFHFAMYGASAAAIYSMSRRHLNSTIGAVGALIFVSVPVAMWEAGNAYSDIATALYVTLAVYAVLNWEQSGEKPWLVICGIMSGFALGTKVLAIVPTAALCLWILLAARSRGGWKTAFGASAAVGLLALLVGSPWYIKSWVYTGNPFYPFLYNIFGGKYWSQSAAEAYRHAQLAFGMGRDFGAFLKLPWNLTVNGAYFFDEPDPTRPKLFSLIGPAFLGLIPLSILAGGRSRLPAKIGFVCAAYVIAWFFLMQQTRYLIGVLPLLSVIAASGLDAANSRWRITRHVPGIFLGLCVILSLLTGYMMALDCSRVAVGIEPSDQYLSRTLDVYDAQEYANEFLPTNARVVFFDEVRGFYLNREYMWGNPGHHEMTPWSSIRDGKDMVSYFAKEGFTHVLINRRLAKYAGEDLLHKTLIPDAIERGLLREVYSSNGVSIYEMGKP